MIKKSVTIIMTLMLIFSFTSCGSDMNADSGYNSTFSDSLQIITDNKAILYSKLTENMPDDMVWASMDMLAVSIMDINLAFVATCGTEDAETGIETAFEMFGLEDVNYTENGTNYKVTAKTSDGDILSYDIQYDKKTDSMIVKYSEGTNGELNFEAVRIDNGYGFMYQSKSLGDDEHYTVKGIVYDNGDGMFATGTTNDMVESIYQNESLINNDFVKQGLTNTYEAADGKCYVLYEGDNYEYEAGTGESQTESD